MLSHAWTAAVALTVAIPVAASHRAAHHPQQAPNERRVAVVATDYNLALPDSLAAGRVTFVLENHGRELHHMVLVHLLDGKSASDFVAAMKANGPPPKWAVWVGGPNGVDPGATSLATTVPLTAGRYAAICIIPDAKGVPHFMKGMVRDLVVTPGVTQAASSGRADATIRMFDYGYRLPAPIRTGTARVRVANDGKQLHEIELVRLAPGKTGHDVAEWVEKMDGPPPAHFLGGVSPLAPGQENELSLSLASGRYALICFIPDAKDQKPHAAHGMIHDFEVK